MKRFRRYLLAAIIWQLLLTIAGSFVFAYYKHDMSLFITQPLAHTMLWDGGWYYSILNGSYFDTHSPSAAFYPLFPLIIVILKTITFGFLDIPVLGIIVNTLSISVALYSLHKISLHYNLGRLPVLLFLAFPTAVFMHFFYTEALFAALGFAAYYLSLKRQWNLVGVLLMLLTATRLPGLLFVLLCGLEYLASYRWRLRDALNKQLLWLLLAPLGFVAYGIFLYIARGDFFGMFTAYKLTNDWAYQHTNLNVIGTLLDQVRQLIELVVVHPRAAISSGEIANRWLPIFSILLTLTASGYFVKKRDYPLAVFGVAATIMFTMNSNVVSAHRYTLPLVLNYLFISFTLKNAHTKYLSVGVITVSLLFQGVILLVFCRNSFAG